MSTSGSLGLGSGLAGYRLEEEIGHGGMGVVYRAHDDALDRSVAVKLVSPGLATDRDFRDRFLVEARMAASLDHPNVIPVHDAGEIDGQLYLAMRYVEGTDLRELLTEQGKLEPERALAICGQVAQALDAAHAKGLVHRDVKPSNVLLDEREHGYLADFGLTRRLTDQAPDYDAGLSIGTPAYVSPEQIEGKDVGPRADQYSLACLLYECLTDEPPFQRPSEAATLYAHLEDEPPDYPGLEPVFARALAKNPDGRYESCTAFIEAARDALPPTSRRTRLLLAAAAALALVAVAAVAAALTLTGGDEAVVGHDWTKVPHNESVFGGSQDTHAEDIAWNESGFVAVGSTGNVGDTDSDVALWTSPDGKTWTRVEDESLGGAGLQFAKSVSAGPSGFTVVGTEYLEPILDGSEPARAAAWRSSDGKEWERIPHDEAVFGLPPHRSMFEVVEGGPGLVAVGMSLNEEQNDIDGAVWTSTDGRDWRFVPSDPEIFAPRHNEKAGVVFMQSLAAAPSGTLVAVGEDFDPFENTGIAAVWVSEDGTSWMRLTHDEVLFGSGTTWTSLIDIAAAPTGFVAVGAETVGPGAFLQTVLSSEAPQSTRAVIVTSEDGFTWTRVPDDQLPEAGENVTLWAVTTGGPGLVAVGWRYNNPGAGTPDPDIDPVVWTSTDGASWNEAADPEGIFSQPGGQLIAEIVSTDEGLVAIGQDGDEKGFNTAIWTSP